MPNIIGKCLKGNIEALGRQTFLLQTMDTPTGRVNQEWLKKEVTRFISTAQGPSKSSDLNSLDFCASGILESKVLIEKYKSVDHLTIVLRRE